MGEEFPQYRKLYRELADKIQSGEYGKTGKLPSEAAVCRETGLSKGTVRRAFDLLEESGYIRRARGSGTYLTRYSQEEEILKGYLEWCLDGGMTEAQGRQLLCQALEKQVQKEWQIRAAVLDCTSEIGEDLIAELRQRYGIAGRYYQTEEVLEGKISVDREEEIWITTKAHFHEMLPLARQMGKRLFKVCIHVNRETERRLRELEEGTVIGLVYENQKLVQHIGCMLSSISCHNPLFLCQPSEWEERRKKLGKHVCWLAAFKDDKFLREMEACAPGVLCIAYQIEGASLNELDQYLESRGAAGAAGGGRV